ncbi:hypothetical protein GNI_013760 [Gregarina niphandrodes]|uniref:Uncharacterized protein n=1 Tax=Gregarina niphandrodes TaxID=110365 RepID=A0A023BCF6_GRENI|nr:hypothetical protein GNI_013760 [Gregarina niphandrodes]EZG83893.1 hypothetical protein GNI_013760 [Gregarina niphandrodes]|eukprot:XP_011128892.1 hypothetical protein GNI_013760 [Gregarina niphandrodes]
MYWSPCLLVAGPVASLDGPMGTGRVLSSKATRRLSLSIEVRGGASVASSSIARHHLPSRLLILPTSRGQASPVPAILATELRATGRPLPLRTRPVNESPTLMLEKRNGEPKLVIDYTEWSTYKCSTNTHFPNSPASCKKREPTIKSATFLH